MAPLLATLSIQSLRAQLAGPHNLGALQQGKSHSASFRPAVLEDPGAAG
jgi:hypothetical protein